MSPEEKISTNASKVVVFAEKITKRYPGTLALDAVDFTVHEGAVNVLIGENGAGKSTLMKILAGAEQPTSGRGPLDGLPVEFKSTREAARAGIGDHFSGTGTVSEPKHFGEHLHRARNHARRDCPARRAGEDYA